VNIFRHDNDTGGIGDLIKGMNAFFSQYEDGKIYITHPISNYIDIKHEYYIEHLPPSDLETSTLLFPYLVMEEMNFLGVTTDGWRSTFLARNFYEDVNFLRRKEFDPQKYFTFKKHLYDKCDEIIEKYKIGIDYQSIHVRMGDSVIFGSTQEACGFEDYRANKEDVFIRIDAVINKFELNKKFLLFSDDEKIKGEINEKYDNVMILPTKICHTGHKMSGTENIEENLCEFILLAKSKKIHSITRSGFPVVASWFFNAEFIRYWDDMESTNKDMLPPDGEFRKIE
jgi:hypothetical protein